MDPEVLLQRACQNYDVDTIRLLISLDVPLEGTNRYGCTPLIIGCRNNPEVARILISAGANCNAQDNFGNTPLHYAVIWDKTEIAKLLLDAGADRNIRNLNREKCTEIPTCRINHTSLFIQNYAYPEDIKEPGCE